MSLSRRLLVFTVVLGAAVAAIPTMTGLAAEGTVSASAVGCTYYPYCWSPPSETAAAGGTVSFQNSTPGVEHGIVWSGGPEPPSCTGVPIDKGEVGWKGSCKFTKAGAYTFYCYVHHYMTGTITVTGIPADETTAATVQNQTEATVMGSITPEGNEVKYLFEYGTGSVSENKTQPVTLSAGNFTKKQSVSAQLKVLPGKTYKFLLVATYESGKSVLGTSELTFETPAAAAPTVEAVKATVSGPEGAILEGKVDPNGGSATEYLFEYATEAEYDAVTETYGKKTMPVTGLPADNLKHTASATLSELHAGTLYHYRLVAKNSAGGPVTSADATFTTASTPPSKEPTPPPTNPTPTPTPTSTPSPGPISPEPELAPLAPALVQGSLKLTAPRHGSSVHGSVTVSSSGARGRLEVDLIASGSSLGKARNRKATATVVGRLVRGSVPAGKASFSISLNALAKSALRRRHRLTVTAKVTLTPTSGPADVVTKSIVVRA